MLKGLTKLELSQQRVLDAAAKIFRDNGYAGTTMRAIADAAGLKAGSIYYHFKSKDDLISAVLDVGINTVMQTVTESLEQLGDDASGRARIECAIQAHLVATIAQGDYTLATRRVFGQVPETIRQQNLRLRNQYAIIWKDILETAHSGGELRADADITLARLFILGALNWTAEWFDPKGRAIEEVAHEFTTLLCSGLFVETIVAGPVQAAMAGEPSA